MGQCVCRQVAFASITLTLAFSSFAQSNVTIDSKTQAEFDTALSWVSESHKYSNIPQFAFYYMQEAAKNENPLALAWLKNEARINSTGALISLGYYYGSKNDSANAVAHFKKAADLGGQDALSVMASIYSEGWYGTPKNEKLGCEWSKKSAEAGNYRDAVEYGFCVGLPVAGVVRDLDASCHWGEVGVNGMKLELERAELSAKNNKELRMGEWLGSIRYSAGRAYTVFATCITGNTKLRHRLHEAADLYRRSYDLGFRYAGYRYGEMLENGEGVAQDYDEAFRWYKKAADDGITSAQNKLGAKYAEGKGVGKNLVEAMKWFIIATANGHEDARDNRDKAEKLLSPTEVKKAQTLASEWMRKHKR